MDFSQCKLYQWQKIYTHKAVTCQITIVLISSIDKHWALSLFLSCYAKPYISKTVKHKAVSRSENVIPEAFFFEEGASSRK